MAELLIPADDEALVVAELAARLPGVHVATRLPRPIPADVIRVVNVGGVGRDLVTDSPRLAVEGFAKTEGRARELCALGVAHLQAAGRAGSVGGTACYGVQVEGLPANLPDPAMPDRYRYSATVSVDLRRSAA